MKNKSAFAKLEEIIRTNRKFFLISHVYTDGDALGSILAMHHYLTRLGKQVAAAVPGKLPEKYRFLGYEGRINNLSKEETLSYIAQADVILILDISALIRMERWYEPVMASKALKVCIDHHPGGCDGVDFQIIDVHRIATAEILFDYFKTNNIQIDKTMALALYTGILSDSGSFRFEGTSAFTLQMAGELAQSGIDPAWVFRQVFENSNKRQLRFWGHVLSNLQSEGMIDWAVVTAETLKRFGVQVEELNGLIDIIRRDASANVFVMFVENGQKEVMVGLRSRDGVNVGTIAKQFGGGGHFHASGFSSSKPIETVVRETLAAIKEKNQKGKA